MFLSVVDSWDCENLHLWRICFRFPLEMRKNLHFLLIYIVYIVKVTFSYISWVSWALTMSQPSSTQHWGKESCSAESWVRENKLKMDQEIPSQFVAQPCCSICPLHFASVCISDPCLWQSEVGSCIREWPRFLPLKVLWVQSSLSMAGFSSFSLLWHCLFLLPFPFGTS